MERIYFEIIYLAGSIFFILGLSNLGSPVTAKKGNLLASTGMTLAILTALIIPLDGGTLTPSGNYLWIAVPLILGAWVGYRAAVKVAMTAMPEMVSVFNGFGGICAVLISTVQLFSETGGSSTGTLLVVLLNLFIGSIAFSGSMLAYAKLAGKINDRQLVIPMNQYLNIVLLVGLLAAIAYLLTLPHIAPWQILLFAAVALIYGFTFVKPIGGADMPVVISLLNSFTGVTAVLTGIIYDDNIVLLGGILVGSSGSILTVLMCRAMNRSLANVIIGSFGGTQSSSDSNEGKSYKTATADDLAILLNYATNVVIIPGYGMAVAQAQKACKELENALADKDIELKYGIHPVAGRMPGHMNVLLAEADVPYSKLMDLDEANQYLANADVAIVVGANDVVNPAAIEDTGSPIYGMPILDLRPVQNTIIIKRSMASGYAGIPNDLFYRENSQMLFSDAKEAIEQVATKLKGMD